MIADLKPYPTMKESGVPWLGHVPESWSVVRNGRLFAERKETGFAELPILEVSLRSGVRVRRLGGDARKQLMSDRDRYKRACAGDLAYNMMRMWQGAVGLAPVDGLVSPAYVVARPFPGVIASYFAYLFRTDAYMREVDQYSHGIVKDRNRLYWEHFKQITSPCPPTKEQAAIVRFLGDTDRQIWRYIGSKQRQIGLLAKRREVITEDALSLAGVRSRRIVEVADRIARIVDRDPNHRYEPIGLYNHGRGIFHKAPTHGAELGDSTFFWIKEGDLVLSGQFAWEGAIALASLKDDGCIASHRYPVLRGKPNIVESAFLLSFFQTGWGRLLLDHHSRGAAGRNRPLNPTSLMKEKISVPPLPVQKQITALLEIEFRTERAIARLIALLREYRDRLIADVVTGKLDVRQAAATLPDEANDIEPLDDIMVDDMDKPADDADLDAADDEEDDA